MPPRLLRGALVSLGTLGALGACSFPRPEPLGTDDASPIIDSAIPPGVSIRVSGTGDDANDGVTQPVKTLKHALGLAAANPDITSVVLATGRYTAAGGETFPYTLPANLTLLGPAGGGAILAGTKAEPGITVADGTLRDLELEDFTVAITATGAATLTGLRVRTETTAVRTEAATKVTADGLDIAGASGACASGIILTGEAQLVATRLSTRNLGAALAANDQSDASLIGASLMGDRMCPQIVVMVATGKSFVMADSVLDAGGTGVAVRPGSGAPRLELTRTILRNFKGDGLSGAATFGGAVMFHMMGGEISGNTNSGVEIGSGGTWMLTDVVIKQNAGLAIYAQETTLVMRGSSVIGNGGGVDVLMPVAVDLGTLAHPGNNIIRNNAEGVGLTYEAGTATVEAVGNTWNPRLQGADDNGLYPNPMVVQGSITYVTGNNYAIFCDPGMCPLHR